MFITADVHYDYYFLQAMENTKTCCHLSKIYYIQQLFLQISLATLKLYYKYQLEETRNTKVNL